MKNYRLEFSEQQQWLRLDNYTHKENTDGFLTIKEECSDLEFKIFEAFLTRTDGLNINDSEIKYRNVDLLEAIEEITIFIKSLDEYNLAIKVK
tara:strand:+ start:150 stop:428 length:279 start_codon:yes stop_codon:yes gene_type:complete